MKRNGILKFLGCLTVILLWGCSDNNLSVDGVANENVQIRATQNVFLRDNSSRSVVGEEHANGALTMNWDVNDEIGVFTSEEINKKFINTNASPSPEATFTLAEGNSMNGIPQVAYYPYAAGNVNRNAISLVIPEVQDYENAASVAQYDAKASSITVDEAGGFVMNMKQMATLLRFEITIAELKNEILNRLDHSEVSVLDIDKQHIQHVLISTNDQVRLTGSYTYNLDDLTKGLSHVATDQSAGSLDVRMVNPLPLNSTDKIVLYAMVAPGLHKGKQLTCILQTEALSFTLESDILCDFEQGKYYMIPINYESIQRAKDVKAVITQETAESVRPSADEETANCYMIHTTGAHEFWGTQIGNGAKGIIPGAGFHTDDPYINPKSAKLVWQDVQNFVSKVTFNPKDGKVHYTANKTSGNALIAVYDGPNGTGNVLWSWHVWGTGDQPVAEEYTNMAGAKFMVMDRTLGAHSKTSLNTTLYQWGRKDPFPNSVGYYTSEGMADLTNIDQEYPVVNDANSTIDTAIQNPDKILNTGNKDWLSSKEENAYLWGDVNQDSYTSFGDWPDYGGGYANKKAGAGWTHQKTIYDPSPVGYRVANKFTFTGFVKDSPKGSTPELPARNKFKYINSPGAGSGANQDNPGKFDKGWYFMKNGSDTEGSYYPMTGRRGADGSLWVSDETTYGVDAKYWTSTFGLNPGDGCGMSLSPYSEDYSTSSNPSSYNEIKTVDDGGLYRSNAFAIRCVKE